MKNKMFTMLLVGFFTFVFALMFFDSKTEAKEVYELPETIQMFMGEITDVEIGECKDSLNYYEACDWIEITMNDKVVWHNIWDIEDLEVGDKLIGIMNVRTGVILDVRAISEEYIENEFTILSSIKGQ